MIKNERQYRITRAQAEKFMAAIEEVPSRNDPGSLLAEIEVEALRGQLDELRRQMVEYEELQSGARGVLYVDSFDKLPQALIQARIAAGLSHKQLADRLGLKEQQVQRYEATEFRAASLTRLQDVINALGINVREEIFLPVKPTSSSSFFDRLNAVGVDREFLLQRIFPPDLAERLVSDSSPMCETDVRQAAGTVGRVFRWKAEDVLGAEPLSLRTETAGIARFKLPARGNERKLSAYTVYAHYLALLVLQATPHLEPKPIPTDPEECRDAILAEYGSASFKPILVFLWNLGVPVVPLRDSGSFHGACWREDGRNILVLKQRTKSQARWANDCLHEAFHAGQEPGEKERSIIEEAEMSTERMESEEEQEATIFSGDVLLDGRAEELANMCVDAASGRVPSLKSVVPMIADSEGVEAGALANYMAFRLSLQGINWWGTATNLQSDDSDPWEIARDWLVPRLDLDQLNDVDRQILMQALTNTEG